MIQLQGDHRTKVMDFLTDKGSDKMGKYALAKENIKVSHFFPEIISGDSVGGSAHKMF